MKGRESGMPDADYWSTFFNPKEVLKQLLPVRISGAVVEFGSGYGTFTLPAGRLFPNAIIGLDIEAELVGSVQAEAALEGLENVNVQFRDFVEQGTGLKGGSAGHAMLYNILHIENPEILLKEAHRILDSQGLLSVIHWRSDIETPRGPSLEIRPTPEQCIERAAHHGFELVEQKLLGDAAPYHYGLIFRKRT